MRGSNECVCPGELANFSARSPVSFFIDDQDLLVVIECDSQGHTRITELFAANHKGYLKARALLLFEFPITLTACIRV